jgi:hypothetical protein
VSKYQDVSGHDRLDTYWRGKRAMREKEEAKRYNFILPAITTMCTYNVGALKSPPKVMMKL